ncbi:uncharacterized protein JN550_009673 [Neoarthrinium moseri]|uniref:uncharacterized protein n=1 Tax=Neoarthrinium moseri TaxID=1658444 RepID=UPI001FDC5BCE|nr:uncharacterized protein JN550_009673 [Neoarthrinium moseri]KAI1863353.1 hypothetical protein JN550_009673 [Neoarthrinium moseri]
MEYEGPEDPQIGETIIAYDSTYKHLNERDLLYMILARSEVHHESVQHYGQSSRNEIASLRGEVTKLRKEICVLRNLIANDAKFPNFARLPAEVRNMVWNLALPAQVVKITHTRSTGGLRFRFATRNPPPAVSQVCQEARQVARRHGAIRAIEHEVNLTGRLRFRRQMQMDPNHQNPPRFEREWSWFDSYRDMLLVDILDSHSRLPPANGLLQLTRSTESVMLEKTGSLRDQAWLEDLFDPHHFPKLKTVIVPAATIVTRPPKDAPDEAQTYRMNSRSPNVLDIDDEGDMSDIARKLGIEPDKALRFREWTTTRVIEGILVEWATGLDDRGWKIFQKETAERFFLGDRIKFRRVCRLSTCTERRLL